MSFLLMDEVMIFSLIMMRMSGFVFLNPIFGRNEIPSMYKAGLVMVLSFLILPTVETEAIEVSGVLVYGILLMKEFAVGFLVGFVMYLFEMVTMYAGTVIDFQMGLSMATVFDAQTNAQVALSSNILRIYYMLLFFAVDGHLAVFKILVTSQEMIPYSQVNFSPRAADAILVIFLECIVLAVKLALPFIAFEFLTEIALGIMAKTIPQISLFVLSIQLRVIMGIIIYALMSSHIGTFLNDVIANMVHTIQGLLNIATI